jgi:hypothetical protein
MPSSPKLRLHSGLRRPGDTSAAGSAADLPAPPRNRTTGSASDLHAPPCHRTAGSAADLPAPPRHRITRGDTRPSPGSSPSSGVQLHRAPSRAAPDVAPLASPELGRSTWAAGPPLASPVLAEMQLGCAEIRRRCRGSGRRRLSSRVVLRRKVRELRRLVPGGEEASAGALLARTADYIAQLRADSGPAAVARRRS